MGRCPTGSASRGRKSSEEEEDGVEALGCCNSVLLLLPHRCGRSSSAGKMQPQFPRVGCGCPGDAGETQGTQEVSCGTLLTGLPSLLCSARHSCSLVWGTHSVPLLLGIFLDLTDSVPAPRPSPNSLLRLLGWPFLKAQRLPLHTFVLLSGPSSNPLSSSVSSQPPCPTALTRCYGLYRKRENKNMSLYLLCSIRYSGRTDNKTDDKQACLWRWVGGLWGRVTGAEVEETSSLPLSLSCFWNYTVELT